MVVVEGIVVGGAVEVVEGGAAVISVVGVEGVVGAADAGRLVVVVVRLVVGGVVRRPVRGALAGGAGATVVLGSGAAVEGGTSIMAVEVVGKVPAISATFISNPVVVVVEVPCAACSGLGSLSPPPSMASTAIPPIITAGIPT